MYLNMFGFGWNFGLNLFDGWIEVRLVLVIEGTIF